MKPYLMNISDKYLRKITSKARKILKLFGWEYDTIIQEKELKSIEISASDIEISPNNTTQISIHKVTTSSNSSDVDKISGEVSRSENIITSKSLSEVSNDRDSDYEYNFKDHFDNSEDDSQSENTNTTKDNENNEDFFNNDEDDNDKGGSCEFSDDNKEGYYYDLNISETYTKSDHLIYAY
ncbi:11964_t:CDS:2 [Ambispora gerdemannii]|uniref:11964_t:CDS:1 n=1 Tax=Ambispora gerdemannii TaxID=144530 RepID=A0A9N9GQ68_9GLOM|nr:11964_t:CDS:2 [Ambispora gerdemannii]